MSKKKTEAKTKKFVKLTRIQTVQLYNWLVSNLERAKTMVANQLAPIASQELEFHVSTSSITTLRKEMGIEVVPAREAKRKVTFALIKMLARELVDLRLKLDEPVSKDLEDLAK